MKERLERETAYSVLELKELRTPPPLSRHPSFHSPNRNTPRIQEPPGGGEEAEGDEDKVTVAESCPGLSLARTTCTGAEKLRQPRGRRLPGTWRAALRRALSPSPRARCAPRQERSGAQRRRPPDPAVPGTGAGWGSPPSAPSHRPLPRISHPAPTHPLSPRERREGRVLLRPAIGRSWESWRPPPACRTSEPPLQPASSPAASRPPSPPRRGKGRGGGRELDQNLEGFEGRRGR